MLNQSNVLDRTFQALADPARRSMLAQLTRGPTSVSGLARPLAMTLPAVMQHLAILEGAGLVRSQKIGRVRTCHLEPRALDVADHWIHQRRLEWERHLDRLARYLENLPTKGAVHDRKD
jgi:DNA-binding transcriptional ArsR family regulator